MITKSLHVRVGLSYFGDKKIRDDIMVTVRGNCGCRVPSFFYGDRIQSKTCYECLQLFVEDGIYLSGPIDI